MIREKLQAVYGRAMGALKGVLGRFAGSARSRGGLLQIAYILLLVGLMAGFVNAVAFPVANQGQVVFPGTGAQTIPEAVIDACVIALGGGGIYLAYISGRQTARSRTVNLYLGAALLLIALSVVTGMDLSLLK